MPMKRSSRAFSKAWRKRSRRKTCGVWVRIESFSRKRGANFVPVNLFDGIDRNDTDDSGSGFACFPNHFLDDFAFNEWPDGIVYSDQDGIRRDSGKRIFDRLLARFPALNGANGFAECPDLRTAPPPR